MIEALVLASPAEARAASDRLAAQAAVALATTREEGCGPAAALAPGLPTEKVPA